MVISASPCRDGRVRCGVVAGAAAVMRTAELELSAGIRGSGGRNARREPKANRTERRKRDDALDPLSLPAPVVLRAGTVSRPARRAHGTSIRFLYFSL
jgi:hypothetical protein